MSLRFHYQLNHFKIRGVKNVRLWLSNVLAEEGITDFDISYFIIDDDNLKEINVEFLEHDYYTDVITFDYSSEIMLKGEIYLSFDTVKRNAVDFETSFQIELRRVLLHGILHLIGYNDKNDEEIKEMRLKEDIYLEKFKS